MTTVHRVGVVGAVVQEKLPIGDWDKVIEIGKVAVVGASRVIQTQRTDGSSERRVVVQVGSQSERSLYGAAGFRHVASERRVNAGVRSSAPQSVDRP